MKGEKEANCVTITVDDAGSGDLLHGVVIGAYRDETQEFTYDLIDVKYFQTSLFRRKEYLTQSSKIVSQLVDKLKIKPEEQILICQGYIFDEAVEELRKAYGEDRVQRVKVVGEPQRLVEIAYLDEIRNLGYEPLTERDEKRAKSFFHMMHWLRDNPGMLRYAKTGWPRLARFRMFKSFLQNGNGEEPKRQGFIGICAECGKECKVPFKPAKDRPIYCKSCWTRRRLK